MSRNEFDSSSALYECIVFSKIHFGEILSCIGSVSIWVYMSYMSLYDSIWESLYELQGS